MPELEPDVPAILIIPPGGAARLEVEEVEPDDPVAPILPPAATRIFDSSSVIAFAADFGLRGSVEITFVWYVILHPPRVLPLTPPPVCPRNVTEGLARTSLTTLSIERPDRNVSGPVSQDVRTQAINATVIMHTTFLRIR